MHGFRISCSLGASVLLAIGLSTGTARAQAYGSLGLSAAPDRYVRDIAVTVGEPFTLYVIATGEDPTTPLPFALDSASWAVFTVCCGGSPVEVTGCEFPSGMQCDGHPYLGVVSDPDECQQQDTVLLATVTFGWSGPGAYSFPVAAGATAPAIDCDGVMHSMFGTVVDVLGLPSGVSADAQTWGGIKQNYRPLHQRRDSW